MFADRGFTAHEHLEDFDLINMNGRLYDPVVGRMLSPDAFVQNAGSTQNFNHYSYCLNNPLKYTDPSGNKYHYIEQVQWVPGAETFFDNGSRGGGSGGFGSPGICGNGTGLNGAYYDWSSGTYKTTDGEGIGFNEIHNNLVERHSDVRYTLTETGYSLDGGKTFTGNGSYSMVRITDQIVATGSTFSLPFRGASNTSMNDQSNGGGFFNYMGKAVTGFGLANTGRSFLEWEYLKQARFNRALAGNFSQPIKNSLRTIKGVGSGTAIVGGFVGVMSFAVSDQSWGNYGQLGVSAISTGLTLGGPTAPFGIGIGAVDAVGGFNGFYNYLDSNEQFYNSTGSIIIPVNGVPSVIRLK